MGQGEIDRALALEQQNYALLAEQGDARALLHWHNGYAEFLLRAGRSGEAAELLQVADTMAPPSRVRTKLFLTQAHLANGNRTRAHDWLVEAASDTNRLGIDYYQPEIAALMQQF